MKRKTVTVFTTALAGLVLLSACTPAPYDPNNPNQNRNTGAIGGAILGGIAGAAAGKGDRRTDEALAGAVIGGIAGGVYGSTLDKQAAELQRDLGNGVGVFRQGDTLVVRMSQDILFATDSAAVQPALQGDLYTLASSLNRYPNTTVVVTGHTDNTGSAAYNQSLSERRANAVSGILINAGVNPSRVRAFGAGEDQPIATNQTAQGRAQNRRVDITIREY